MSGWETLVSTALLGTERRPPQPVDGVPALDWSDGEGALLTAAALLSTARAAGVRAARAPEPERAPEDPTPICSPGADAVLARILAEHDELLEEWVERAAQAGVRVRPRRLPDLLTAGTYDHGLRGAVLRVGGRPATWLAAQWPDWSWATADPADPEAWETGSREERVAMLAAVRAGDPAAGRALIEATWDTDSADDRRAFVAALETGLSPGDEPLLERALDSRRSATRRAAADLLARLPDSAYASRMAERLAPLLSLTRKRIEVELPEAFDAAMDRDGMRQKGAPREIGERGWWLRQIIWHAPLRVWTERLGLSAAKIVERLRQDRELLLAIENAAAIQGDPEWGAALAEKAGRLVLGLPADTAGPALRTLVRATRTLDELIELTALAEGPWDAETSAAVLDAVERAKVDQVRHWLRPQDLRPLARRLDPMLLDRAAAALARHDGAGIAPNAGIEVLSVLDLRLAILREIP